MTESLFTCSGCGRELPWTHENYDPATQLCRSCARTSTAQPPGATRDPPSSESAPAGIPPGAWFGAIVGVTVAAPIGVVAVLFTLSRETHSIYEHAGKASEAVIVFLVIALPPALLGGVLGYAVNQLLRALHRSSRKRAL